MGRRGLERVPYGDRWQETGGAVREALPGIPTCRLTMNVLFGQCSFPMLGCAIE